MTPQFPNEVIEAILLYLPPLCRCLESVRTLCRVGLTNSRFLAVSRLPNIWEPHYVVRWKRSDPARDESRKSSANGDWCRMFYARMHLERTALALLDAMIPYSDRRKSLAVQLVYECGLDVWEAISEETTRVILRYFWNTESLDRDSVPVEGLTRQYWAREILGVISRSRAIGIWLPLANTQTSDVSYEKLLGAFAAFFDEDIESIFEEFDKVTADCQEHLRTQGITEASDLVETVTELCVWMRQRGFVRGATTAIPASQDPNYLVNHLPHRALFEQPDKLPMSLAYVFICIAQRLGINARPVSFPSNVIVMISSPADDPVYVDLFCSSTQPVYYGSRVQDLLPQLGMNVGALLDIGILSPTPLKKMLLRVVRNILHCLGRRPNRSPIYTETDDVERYGRPGHFAGYCAALLLTGDMLIVPCLFESNVGGPLDSEVVLKHMIRPALAPNVGEKLDRLLRRQDFSDTCVPRVAGRGGVKHFVGMLCHNAIHDVSVIKRWDYQCEEGEGWVRDRRVDKLPRGTRQPFYHCFTPSGHERYIPEELIRPIHSPRASDIRLLINANKDLGRWFDGVEFNDFGAVRFTLSEETRMLYPDDDMAGRMFLNNEGYQ